MFKHIKTVIDVVFIVILCYVALLIIQPLKNPISSVNFIDGKIFSDTNGVTFLYFKSEDLNLIRNKTNSTEYISFECPLDTPFNIYKKTYNKRIIGRYFSGVYNFIKDKSNFNNKPLGKLNEYKCQLTLYSGNQLISQTDLNNYLKKLMQKNEKLVFYGYLPHNPLASMYQAAWTKPIEVKIDIK